MAARTRKSPISGCNGDCRRKVFAFDDGDALPNCCLANTRAMARIAELEARGLPFVVLTTAAPIRGGAGGQRSASDCRRGRRASFMSVGAGCVLGSRCRAQRPAAAIPAIAPTRPTRRASRAPIRSSRPPPFCAGVGDSARRTFFATRQGRSFGYSRTTARSQVIGRLASPTRSRSFRQLACGALAIAGDDRRATRARSASRSPAAAPAPRNGRRKGPGTRPHCDRRGGGVTGVWSA